MSKHTPGEWKHDEGSRVVRANQRVIANVGDLCIVSQWQEDKANARLIAAAPELLAACKAIAAWADRECLPMGGRNDGPWELIDAAIAKAESH